MLEPSHALFPPPRHFERTEGRLGLRGNVGISIDGCSRAQQRERLARAASRMLERREIAASTTTSGDATLRLRLADGDLPPAQGYRLRVTPAAAVLEAGDEAGLHHGLATLGQWLDAHHEAGTAGLDLPCLTVHDHPDLRVRGALLDTSRDKVPTRSTLLTLVDRLADWKINQLQLYTEHTFAYRGHEAVWQRASPLTPGDVRVIDDACRDRGIELVPNQNSLGHFHRWLVHDAYRPLAEVPEGIAHPFSRATEPFSLCPTDPAVLDLLAGLYDQLLPCFRSTKLNVGLDEVFDLGKGRSADALASSGAMGLYLAFVEKIHQLLGWRGRAMQMWGDMLLAAPEHLSKVPEGVTVLAWGYEADHPFARDCARLRDAGQPFYVCPGTSSWLSLGGRHHNALHNLASAARHGHAFGADGILITDWGDRGHLQPLPISYPGLMAGAAFAWNVDLTGAPETLALVDGLTAGGVLGTHDPAPARALLRLADAYRAMGTPARFASPLHHLLTSPGDDLEHVRYRGLSTSSLDATADEIAGARSALATGHGRIASHEAQQVAGELEWVADLMQLAVDIGRARLRAGRGQPLQAIGSAQRRTLRAHLDATIDRHGPIWLARNRPGGRTDSVSWLERLATDLA